MFPEYTKPEKTEFYTSSYPDLPEFKEPGKESLYVGQGYAEMSVDNRSILSEGFSSCIALVLQDYKTGNAALFHIDDIDLRNDFNRKQTLVVQNLLERHLLSISIPEKERELLLFTIKEICNYQYPTKMKREECREKMARWVSGQIQARFVVGTTGRYGVAERVYKDFLSNVGMFLKPLIVIDSGDFHWGIVYKPGEKRILVQTDNQKKLLTFLF